MQDNDLIAENTDLMFCDVNNKYHCLLIYDEDQGDGLLIESEGAAYARYPVSVETERDDGGVTLTIWRNAPETERPDCGISEEEIERTCSIYDIVTSVR